LYGTLLDEAKATAKSAKLIARLLLHEVEAHGDQSETAHEVQATHDVLLRPPRIEAGSGDIVAEADGGQRDEAEIGSDQRLPVFGQAEEKRTEKDIATHQQEADAYRHAHLQAYKHIY